MEPMTVRFVSAVRTKEGAIRARVRVESKAHHGNRPQIVMNVVLSLPLEDDLDDARPIPERVYEEVLRYLDIA